MKTSLVIVGALALLVILTTNVVRLRSRLKAAKGCILDILMQAGPDKELAHTHLQQRLLAMGCDPSLLRRACAELEVEGRIESYSEWQPGGKRVWRYSIRTNKKVIDFISDQQPSLN